MLASTPTCAPTMDLFGLKQPDLMDVVGGVVSVGQFTERAEQGKMTLFIR